MDVPTISTARLDLVRLSPEAMQAVVERDADAAFRASGVSLDDEWIEDAQWLCRFRLEQLEKEPLAAPWLLRAIVFREDAKAVGHINFHGPPEAGVAELGYGIMPGYRRRGIALEAIEAMFSWARSQGTVERFRASVSPSNEPSLALVAKLGFARVGEQIDEIDGLEWVFERAAD